MSQRTPWLMSNGELGAGFLCSFICQSVPALALSLRHLALTWL